MRGRGGRDALSTKQILDRQGNAVEGPQILAPPAALIGLGGALLGQLRRFADEGVERAALLHGLKMGAGEFQRAEFTFRQPVRRLGDGKVGQRAHSTTLGTAKKPDFSFGALAKISSALPPSVT